MGLWLKQEDGTLVNVASDGVIGADGAQGPAGDDGAQGPAGTDGAQGPAGTDGGNGAKGDKGNPGTNGTNGGKGDRGEKGATGPAGSSTTFNGGTVANNTTFNGEVYTKKWVRCDGNLGIYFTAYGGGFRMEDTQWIKTYSGKGIMASGGGMAAAGLVESSSTGGYANVMVNHAWTFFAKYMSVRRIKERIAPMSDSVNSGEIIDMLNPVTFIERKRGEGPELPGVKKYREDAQIWGFIAEEVCDIDTATGARLGSYDLTEDEKGFQPASWSVAPMVALIVDETKQLRSRSTELEDKVSMLEDRLNKLEQGV